MQRRTYGFAQMWSKARLAAAVSWWALQPVPGRHTVEIRKGSRP